MTSNSYASLILVLAFCGQCFSDVASERITNIAVFKGTQQHLANAHYPPLQVSAFEGLSDISGPTIAPRNIVKVIGVSTFAMAQELVSRGLRPLVLDKANSTSPCGSVTEGSLSQEETLCRQSNLCNGLLQAQELGLFPIVVGGGILVRGVTFFRNDAYDFIEAPFQVDVFASAAFNCNRKHKPEPSKNLFGYDRPASDLVYQEGTKAKIRAFFRAAKENNNDAVVLSAFGCGAFKNDPRKMARWYKEVLGEKEFDDAFKEIIFAIAPEGSNHFKAFYQAFNQCEALVIDIQKPRQ